MQEPGAYPVLNNIHPIIFYFIGKVYNIIFYIVGRRMF